MKHNQKGKSNSSSQTLDLCQLQRTPPPISQQELDEARLAAVKQLAGGIAHHYNNALQIIMTAAELALQRPGASTSVKKDLALIIQQSEEAALIGRQLLDFSGQPVVGTQQVDLANIIKEAVEELKGSIPENIRIGLAIDESKHGPYAFKANPAQIRQVLTNLVANAQEAMPLGGELQICVSGFDSERQPLYSRRMADHWMVLSVSDTGVGIPDDALSRIFEPFFTTKEVGQGTGLGLAQVYGIVKQYGGEIEVESQVGRGTTLYLYFPTLPPSWRWPEQIATLVRL